jgi:2-polyprenyl-3-methyl-5-hydroxy-6-metoxy-1,4-benzoquinol methylase
MLPATSIRCSLDFEQEGFPQQEDGVDVVLCLDVPEHLVDPWSVVDHKRQLLLSNQFVTPSMMACREAKHRFAENQRRMKDHMLLLQILIHEGQIVKLLPEPAAIHKERYGVQGLSA